jgi:hypothetical protein
MLMRSPDAAEQIANELRAYIDRVVMAGGGETKPIKPAHRIKFHWPPHPVSYSYHVLASDWTGQATMEAYGETFRVEVADTPFGVFGRCPELWHEDRGETLDEMLANLRRSSEPLFERQLAIGRTLELDGRFKGHISELSPLDILKLLYCEDRDVANEAHTEIETHASNGLFFPGLIAILDDRSHPHRRSAQWCVLDLFEALPTFIENEREEVEAVRAVKGLIWDAEDDYARTIYKAGVVLGGHIPYTYGGPILLECLHAPSKVGRRSAIHGLFHVVEWVPESKDEVVAALKDVALHDSEPLLRHFAGAMAKDIEVGELDHIREPVFPDED